MRHIAKRKDIRDLILDAVDVLLAKYGYRKMTMEDVARQVGIGKGTIYIHFPGKEELILSLSVAKKLTPLDSRTGNRQIPGKLKC